MAKVKIKLIRGTGFKSLDGSLVTIVEERDDGLIAVVPYGMSDIVPIVIDARCLQEVSNLRSVSYKFMIEKYDADGLGYTEMKHFYIEHALRDVPLITIIDYLDSNLRPILKME